MERQLDAARRRHAAGARSRAKGIEVLPQCRDRARSSGKHRSRRVELKDGRSIPADLVVVAVGIAPNVALARRRRPRRSIAASSSTTACRRQPRHLRDRRMRRASRPLLRAGRARLRAGERAGAIVSPAIARATTAAFSPPISRSPASTCSRPAISSARPAPSRSLLSRSRARHLQEAGHRRRSAGRRGAVRRYRRRPLVSRPDPHRRADRADSATIWCSAARSPSASAGRVRRDMSGDFTPDQKRYLEGLCPGLHGGARRDAAAVPARQGRAEPGPTPSTSRRRTAPSRPAASSPTRKNSSASEHPFDAYDRLKEQADKQRTAEARRQFPLALLRPVLCRAGAEPLYVPAAHPERHPQRTGSSPGSPMSPRNMRGGYSHVTTRANLQIREIEPKNAVAVVEAIQDLGLCSRGSGADNIRNVTGTPTAGIDPQELLDTRPYAREWHHHILNDRALYGLPRKFNVAFDGAGRIAVLEDTNDIGFQAVEVKDGFGVEPGVWFRLALGGITGHKDFARDTGVIVQAGRGDRGRRRHRPRLHRARRPHQPQQGAAEIRARRLGLREIPGRCRGEARPQARRACRPRPWRRARSFDRLAHIGVHPQKQAGPQLDRRRAAGRQDDRPSRCAASPRSRATSATAISASPSGRTC